MNKKATKATPTKAPLRTTQDERTRAHRAINWVVSVILVVFAIWSIQLNAQGRAMLKQTTAFIEATDTKIDAVTEGLQQVREACQMTPIVIPTTPVDPETSL